VDVDPYEYAITVAKGAGRIPRREGRCESVAPAHAGRVAVDVDPYAYAITVAKGHAEFHAGRVVEITVITVS